jgi:hypothetical protein
MVNSGRFGFMIPIMSRHRPFYAGMLGMLLLLPISCARMPTYVPDPSRQLKIAQGLPIAGPWSTLGRGLRCRILLGWDSASETDSIPAALQIENASQQPVELISSGSPPFSGQRAEWRIGGQAMTVDAAQPAGEGTTASMTLAPGKPFITEPVFLLIPSGGGMRQIDAQFPTGNEVLQALPVPVMISAAPWGQTEDGARLRLGSAQSRYVVGEGLMLRAFIENTSGHVLVLHPPGWSTLNIETPRERLLMQVKTADASYVESPSGQFWHEDIPDLPLLAPGTYKLRLEIDSPELPVSNRLAWHGKLVSNELVVEVVVK